MNKILLTILYTFNIICIAIIGIIGLNACAGSMEFHYELVDKELQPYVNEYMFLLKRYCPNNHYNTSHQYVIELVEDGLDNPNWAAVCTRKVVGFNIRIDKTFWEQADKTLRQELIDHEMAHCFIYKPHVTDNKNYMWPILLDLDHTTYTKQAIKDIQDFCGK